MMIATKDRGLRVAQVTEIPWWQVGPAIVGVACLALFAYLGSDDALNQVALWLIEGILALSLTLV